MTAKTLSYMQLIALAIASTIVDAFTMTVYCICVNINLPPRTNLQDILNAVFNALYSAINFR